MVEATPRGLARQARSLTPRAWGLTGGALMVAGQAIFAIMLLARASMPSLDASAFLVVPVLLAGIALLWLAPVVVAGGCGAGSPVWRSRLPDRPPTVQRGVGSSTQLRGSCRAYVDPGRRPLLGDRDDSEAGSTRRTGDEEPPQARCPPSGWGEASDINADGSKRASAWGWGRGAAERRVTVATSCTVTGIVSASGSQYETSR
jgi:hypothetical protein